ncbi:hypothetical protein [Sediminimonas sp.]|uniref:hypothetical protein n=1 Tax=Sediminimonas sp. TaxID=2823379 RepID=UPI0025ECD9AE|nr:hypothetical protein [Sediminimonas sp.]
MALFQSATAKRRHTPPVPQQAGVKAAAVFTYAFNKDFTAADDILEIGMLPAGAQVLGATVIGESLGATTADIGIMTGDAGENDETRTSGIELFDDVSVNDNEAAASVKTCLALTPEQKHRGIGVVLSANVVAGAGKKITLVIEYVY